MRLLKTENRKRTEVSMQRVSTSTLKKQTRKIRIQNRVFNTNPLAQRRRKNIILKGVTGQRSRRLWGMVLEFRHSNIAE